MEIDSQFDKHYELLLGMNLREEWTRPEFDIDFEGIKLDKSNPENMLLVAAKDF